MINFELTFARVVAGLKDVPAGEVSLSEIVALPGVSGSASLVVTTTSSAVTPLTTAAATAKKSVYEGMLLEASRGTWAGDEVLSQTVGVREENSSLAEGQFLVSSASGTFVATQLAETPKAVDGWYLGPEIDTLAGVPPQLSESVDIYAMASTYSRPHD